MWLTHLVKMIERLYTLDYDSMTINSNTSLLSDETLVVMLSYCGMNIDDIVADRFNHIIAKVLYTCFSEDERDNFFRANKQITYLQQQQWVQYSTEDWPEPNPLDDSLSAGLSLHDLRKRLTSKVNFECGRIRSKMITATPGKELVYMGKFMELIQYAQARANGTNINPEDYPFIALEIGNTYGGFTITNMDESAYILNQIANAWKTNAVMLEKVSQGASKIINNIDIKDRNVLIAAANIDWPRLFPALYAPEEIPGDEALRPESAAFTEPEAFIDNNPEQEQSTEPDAMPPEIFVDVDAVNSEE